VIEVFPHCIVHVNMVVVDRKIVGPSSNPLFGESCSGADRGNHGSKNQVCFVFHFDLILFY
jgi:hypothetical protein